MNGIDGLTAFSFSFSGPLVEHEGTESSDGRKDTADQVSISDEARTLSSRSFSGPTGILTSGDPDDSDDSSNYWTRNFGLTEGNMFFNDGSSQTVEFGKDGAITIFEYSGSRLLSTTTGSADENSMSAFTEYCDKDGNVVQTVDSSLGGLGTDAPTVMTQDVNWLEHGEVVSEASSNMQVDASHLLAHVRKQFSREELIGQDSEKDVQSVNSFVVRDFEGGRLTTVSEVQRGLGALGNAKNVPIEARSTEVAKPTLFASVTDYDAYGREARQAFFTKGKLNEGTSEDPEWVYQQDAGVTLFEEGKEKQRTRSFLETKFAGSGGLDSTSDVLNALGSDPAMAVEDKKKTAEEVLVALNAPQLAGTEQDDGEGLVNSLSVADERGRIRFENRVYELGDLVEREEIKQTAEQKSLPTDSRFSDGKNVREAPESMLLQKREHTKEIYEDGAVTSRFDMSMREELVQDEQGVFHVQTVVEASAETDSDEASMSRSIMDARLGDVAKGIHRSGAMDDIDSDTSAASFIATLGPALDELMENEPQDRIDRKENTYGDSDMTDPISMKPIDPGIISKPAQQDFLPPEEIKVGYSGSRDTAEISDEAEDKQQAEKERLERVWSRQFGITAGDWTVNSNTRREVTVEGGVMQLLEYKGDTLVRKMTGTIAGDKAVVNTERYGENGEITMKGQSIITGLSDTSSQKTESTMQRHMEWFEDGELIRSMSDSMSILSQYSSVDDPTEGTLEEMAHSLTNDKHTTDYRGSIQEYADGKLIRSAEMEHKTESAIQSNRTPDKRNGIDSGNHRIIKDEPSFSAKIVDYDKDGNMIRSAKFSEEIGWKKKSITEKVQVMNQSTSVEWYDKGQLVKRTEGSYEKEQTEYAGLPKRGDILTILGMGAIERKSYSIGKPESASEMLAHKFMDRTTDSADNIESLSTYGDYDAVGDPNRMHQGEGPYEMRVVSELFGEKGQLTSRQVNEEGADENVFVHEGLKFRTARGLTEGDMPSTVRHTGQEVSSYENGREAHTTSIKRHENLVQDKDEIGYLQTVSSMEQDGERKTRVSDKSLPESDPGFRRTSEAWDREVELTMDDLISALRPPKEGRASQKTNPDLKISL